MAKTVLLSTLIDRALRRADKENSNNYVSRAEILDYYDSSWGELYEKYIDSGLVYSEASTNIVTSGVQNYNLPTDFMREKRMDYNFAPWLYPIRKIEVEEIHLYPTANVSRYALAYRLINNTVSFYPTPLAGQTYTLVYIQNPVNLTSESLTIEGVSGFEELLVIDVAIKIKIKAGADIGPLEMMRKRVMARIDDLIEARQAAMAQREMAPTPDPNNNYCDGPPLWPY